MKTVPVLILLAVLCQTSTLLGQAIKVEVRQSAEKWTLYRDNQPYYVKGVGGHVHLDVAVEIGANSIRTWGIDDAKQVLDLAHDRGLTVMVGLWVGHERHGFDYDDPIAVQRQFNHFKAAVEELKNHPAILLWGIGNEVDLFYSNIKVWDAIQEIAKMVHEVDPNHPTSTVTAGLDSNEVFWIKQKAPDIDILGINTYGDLAKVPKTIRQYGWKKAYMITEWGPNGHWEVAKTSWDAPIEQNSEEKSNSYNERYAKHILPFKADGLVGSYVFLWGQKQETTETWYGLFDAQGRPTRPIDMLQKHWKGSLPANQAPVVSDIKIISETELGDNVFYTGSKVKVSLVCSDPDNDRIKVLWTLMPEASNTKAGGDAEQALNTISGHISKEGFNGADLRIPATEGAYRLYVKIVDPLGKVGYANLPFYAYPRPLGQGPSQWIEWKTPSLDIPTTSNSLEP